MKDYFLLFFILLIPFSSFSQKNKSYIDSLFGTLKNDTASVKLLDSISYELSKKSMDTSIIIGRKALEMAEKLDFSKGAADVTKTLGYIYLHYCIYDESLFYYKKSLELNRELGRLRETSMVLNNIGIVYKRISKFDVSAQYYLESLKIKEKLGDSTAIINAYNGLGSLYNRVEDYKKAVEYYNKGMDLAKKQKNKFYIGLISSNLALTNYELGNYELAFEYVSGAISILEYSTIPEQASNSYNTMGYVLSKLRRYTEALDYFGRSNKLSAQIGNREAFLDSYLGTAEVLSLQGLKEAAIKKYVEAEKIAIEYKNIYKQRYIYQQIAELWSGLGNIYEAFNYQKKFIQINDSVFNIEKLNKINELNIGYDVEKKDQEILLLSKETELKDLRLNRNKTIIFSFVGLSLMGLTLFLLLFKAYISKRKNNALLRKQNSEIEQQKEEIMSQHASLEILNNELNKQKEIIANQRDKIETELRETIVKKESVEREKIQFQYEALKNQVNPHFLFNNFATLTTLISEDKQLAEKYVFELTNVYRYILTSSEEQLQNLSTELQFIESYMFLVNIRFNNQVKIELSLSPECKECFIPLLSLQLLVENAIKHNTINSKKSLKIDIKQIDDMLVISNNRNPKKIQEKSTGIGLQNIINRYELITDRKVEIQCNDFEFIVRLPLIKNCN
jgi:tetratricopeptide (TPR) repeat protein